MNKSRPKPQKASGSSPKQLSKQPLSSGAKTKNLGKVPQGKSGVSQIVQANLLMIAVVFLLTVINVGLVVYAQTRKIEVIATTESGALVRPVPLPQAFVTVPRVLGFVEECLRDSFSHDFENYRRTMTLALSCYSTVGSKEFARVMDPNLQEIRSKRVVLSVTTMPPALLRGPMLINGRATWEVNSVITLHYQGTRERYPSQSRNVVVTVVRVPIEENPRGIAINAIQLSPYAPTR